MLEKRFVKFLLCLAVVFGFSATVVKAGNILFISSLSEEMMPGDDALKAYMQSLGHTVTYFDHSASEADTEAAAAEADLVFISESVSSQRIRDEITEVEVPMIITEMYAWDEMGLMTGEGTSPDVATTDIEIVAPDHPLAAGLSGTVTVLTALESARGPARFANGAAGGEATVIARATLSDGVTYDVIYIYEKRAALAQAPNDGSDPVAAHIRICLGFDEQSYLVWNENAYALLGAAITYVLGTPVSPEQAARPLPAENAEDVPMDTTLSWRPGIYADKHDVYFGTVFDDVNEATRDNPLSVLLLQDYEHTTYEPPEPLEFGQTYYWRVDEVNELDPNSPWKGNVWSFTVVNYLVVEDFESYDANNRIWYTWHDGLPYDDPCNPPPYPGNNTGAEVGDLNTDSYTEEIIVHGPEQAMPCLYNNNKEGYLAYSEAKMTLSSQRDWTEQNVKALSLWFRGYPAYVGSFTEDPAGTYTMTATGADIWRSADEFHYAYKMLAGAGSITARVESVLNTHDIAKTGVMIRETLEAGSRFAAVYITPGYGCRFQLRQATDMDATSDTDVATDEQIAITAPYWVKLERDLSGYFRGYYSSDGSNWTLMSWGRRYVPMTRDVYVGIPLTSHNPDAVCEAVVSNVTIDGEVTGEWQSQDIGIRSNDPEPMYLAIASSTGTPVVVYHDDPNAATIDDWTEWNIDLKELEDQGIILSDVNSIAIGWGDRDDPQPGGSGKMYFDDIRLYRSRCVPDKLTLSEADLNADCVVDCRDLEIMALDWLASGDLAGDVNTDSTVDLKDYAVLADQWLDEQQWP